MPINNFSGDTFVAFMDISGFKELMKQNNAIKALDKLYTYGYHALQSQQDIQNIRIEGMFISDSAILFVNSNLEDQCRKLGALLSIIKRVNQEMLQHNYMLTTSIAYGEFSYQNRIEFQGIEKNPIYGGAYVKAFLDNENTKPKIQPGQCRILIDNTTQNLMQECEQNTGIFRMIRKINHDSNHLRFYWNLEREDEIVEFENRYNNSYKAKYAGMLEALKN